LNKLGSEDFVPAEPVDLCFTSPPYFDTEKYTNEATQSYIKFPTMNKWLNGFIYQTTQNCYKCLRRDGILAFNISDSLAEPFLKVCTKVGFRHVETLQLRLAGMPGRGKKNGVYTEGTFKNEPVLIFEKR
jgi:DNA modification methylase